MKTSIVPIACGLAFLLASCATSGDTPVPERAGVLPALNLVINPGFEGALDSNHPQWWHTAPGSPLNGLSRDSSTWRSGAASLRLDFGLPGNYPWEPHVKLCGLDLEAGRRYTMSVWLKAETPVRVVADLRRDSKEVFYVQGSFEVGVDWKRFELSFDATEDVARDMMILFHLDGGRARVWADDLWFGAGAPPAAEGKPGERRVVAGAVWDPAPAAGLPAMIALPAAAFPGGPDDSSVQRVAAPYWLGRTEIPYGLFRRVRDWAVSEERGAARYSFAPGYPGAIPLDEKDWASKPPLGDDSHPATMVTWRDAMLFCNALTEWTNANHGTSLRPVYYADPSYAAPLRASAGGGRAFAAPGEVDLPYVYAREPGNTDILACAADGFRLPGSAEWELAARWIADANGDGDILDEGEAASSGMVAGQLPGEPKTERAALKTAPDRYAAPVGSLGASALGFKDLSGNVEEWLFDGDPTADRPWRAARGGSWLNPPEQVSIRDRGTPATLWFTTSWRGLRVARTIPDAVPPPLLDAPFLGRWIVAWQDGGERSVGKVFGPDGGYREIHRNFPELGRHAEYRGWWAERDGRIEILYTHQRVRTDGRFPEVSAHWVAYHDPRPSSQPYRMTEAGLYWGLYVTTRKSGEGSSGTFEALYVEWARVAPERWEYLPHRAILSIDADSVALETWLEAEPGSWRRVDSSRARIAWRDKKTFDVTTVEEGSFFKPRSWGWDAIFGEDWLVLDRPLNLRW